MGGRSITGTGDEGITLMGNAASGSALTDVFVNQRAAPGCLGQSCKPAPAVPMHNLGKVLGHDEERSGK
jgi:hypothetical protein